MEATRIFEYGAMSVTGVCVHFGSIRRGLGSSNYLQVDSFEEMNATFAPELFGRHESIYAWTGIIGAGIMAIRKKHLPASGSQRLSSLQHAHGEDEFIQPACVRGKPLFGPHRIHEQTAGTMGIPFPGGNSLS